MPVLARNERQRVHAPFQICDPFKQKVLPAFEFSDALARLLQLPVQLGDGVSHARLLS